VKQTAIFAAAMMVLFAPTRAARAQSQGPVIPPPKSEVKKTVAAPTVVLDSAATDEIVHKFAANEDRMKKAYEQFSFTLSVKVQEQTNPGGEFQVTGDSFVRSDGLRYERIVKAPVSTLKQTSFTLEDVKIIASLPLFYLTSDEVGNYKFKYQGTEKMDELDTFIFRVQPKLLDRNKKLFDGVIWVEQRDFTIVKSSGKFVREVEAEGVQLPFVMFDTFRENVAGQYWFPTYISSEDMVTPPKSESIPLKLVVRSTNFQPNPVSVSSAPAGNPASPPPTKPN
jgi:hypothetical protein